MMECYPDDPFLLFNQIKRRVEQLSGVVPIFHDMCQDTYVGFTGPFVDCDRCPICGRDRYQSGTQEPNRQFITIPLGPVLQALYNLLETADNMHYREWATAEILDYARMHSGRSRATVTLPAAAIIWTLSRLERLKRMTYLCSSLLTVPSSIMTKNLIAGYLSTSSTIWPLICATRKGWSSLQDLFQAPRKWRMGILFSIQCSTTYQC